MQPIDTPTTLGTVVDQAGSSGVSWGAIIAGAAGAAALTYILVILGFGLGLSSISPWSNEGLGATALGIATIGWLTFTQIAASGLGGYLAGRLRVKWADVHGDEVYFRDTAHGFLSWSVASLVVVVFLASAIGGVVKGGAAVAGTAISTVGSVAGGAATAAVGAAATNTDESGYFVDGLFRSMATPVQPSPADLDPAAPPVGATPQQPASAESRAEVARILMAGIRNGSLAEQDKQYLVRQIARQTGVSEAEATQRLDSAFNSYKQSIETAKESAKQAADEARKQSAKLALWFFVSLLIGAFVASLAATLGGRQRDADLPIRRTY